LFSVHKESLVPLAKLMHVQLSDIGKIELQWNKLHLIEWKHTTNTTDFWREVGQYLDSSGVNPFFELVNLAKSLLVLPWSNGEVERSFSQLNIVKNSHRNRMCHQMTNAILTIRSGLHRINKCCNDYVVPRHVLDQIGTSEAYTSIQKPNDTTHIHHREELFYKSDPDELPGHY